MSAQDNAARIRGGYEAFAAGDLDSVSKLFSPEIRWHISGTSQISGTYTGHDEVFGFFARLVAETAGTFEIDIHDLLASDEHVVVLVRESASRGDRRLEMDEAHVWHLADGMATEFWGIAQDQHAADAFWA